MRNWSNLFELQDAAQARWLAMEGLRGLAVTLVFFVHYSELIEPLMRTAPGGVAWLNAIHELGNSGVDLFFVLSGFLIYKACIHRPLDLRRYDGRHFERIYPTFLVVLAFYIAIMLAAPSTSKLPPGLGDQLGYIGANLLLLPGMLDIQPIITVAWSLSYEAFFYILAPLAVLTLSMRGWKAWHRIAFFLVIGIAMTIAAAAGYYGRYRASMFLGGMVLYEIVYHLRDTGRPLQRSVPADILALALLVFGVACFTLLGETRWLIAGTPLDVLPSYAKFPILNIVIVYLVFRCLFATGPASAVFSFTPLRWLGNMSYSYYLFHGFALQVFFAVIGPAIPASVQGVWLYPALLLPAFAASIVLSVPLYLFIERPFSLVGEARGKGLRARLRACFAPATKQRS